MYFFLTPRQRFNKLKSESDAYEQARVEMAAMLKEIPNMKSRHEFVRAHNRVEVLLSECPRSHRKVLKQRADLTKKLIKAELCNRGLEPITPA